MRGGKFSDAFALLVEKRGKHQQQTGTISIANQGIEMRYRKEHEGPIEGIQLDTDYFRRAQIFDAAKSLLLDENQIVGNQDIGLAVMPGSIDAGGLVIAEINYKEIKKRYEEKREQAKKEPEKAWKIPMMVKVDELSDFLKSSDNVNSLLKESSLGRLIDGKGDYVFNLDFLFEKALENGAGGFGYKSFRM